MRTDLIRPDDPRWQASLDRLPRYDFYHLGGYLAAEADRLGGSPWAFVAEADGHLAFIPFLEAPVPDALQTDSEGATFKDALAPYGYGGPLFSSPPVPRPDFARNVVQAFVTELRQRHYSSLFVRFHPLIAAPADGFAEFGAVVAHGETVFIDLQETAEQLMRRTRSSIRYDIRRMQSKGFQVELDHGCQRMGQFVELYHETMTRVGAAPTYFFTEAYFRRLQAALGPRLFLAAAVAPDGRVPSIAMFTAINGIVQYHLCGSHFDDAANAAKLVLHDVALWAKAIGHTLFHLGGGVAGKSDTLLHFKKGFSPLRSEFYTWRCIIDRPAYDRFTLNWQKKAGLPPDSMEGYFPAYRKDLGSLLAVSPQPKS